MRSAIFLSSDSKYHADRCEPLVQAAARGEVRVCALMRRGYPGRPLPPRVLPEVSTVGYWDAPGPQSWGLDWHRNEGVEITYLARGQTDFQVENHSHRLKNGQLTITRPWQRHKVGNPHVGASRLYWLILDVGVRRPDQPWHWPPWLILSPDDRDRLTLLLRHNEQPVWQSSAEIRRCFEKIGELVETPDPRSAQTRLQLFINELFLALLDLVESQKPALDASLATTRRSVEMFLAALPRHVGQPWTLEEMARQCGLGRSRFASYCREITNLSPMEHLARCRIEVAKGQLRAQPELSVTDAAFACGFQSSQYFATTFRRLTGQSPRQYRETPSQVRQPAKGKAVPH
jgi:AraC family L-rhamnose operon regulatory protein RhaS